MQVKFEQNRIVQTTRNFELFDKTPFLKPFLTKRWRHFGSWNNCLMQNLKTTVFQCFKHYGCLTRVTRLKVVPNVANLICIKDSDCRLSPIIDKTFTFQEIAPNFTYSQKLQFQKYNWRKIHQLLKSINFMAGTCKESTF